MAGRPKNRRPHQIKFNVPKDAERYKAKRLYWALLEMEKKMSKDITSVSMKDYNYLLSAYVELVDTLKSKGTLKYAKERVDEGGSDQGGSEGRGSQGVGKNGSSDILPRVPATNPIT